MILAARYDTPYNIVLALHVILVVAAFAPVFVHPLLGAAGRGESDRKLLYRAMANNGRRLHAPALALAGILGFGLVGMSGDTISMGDAWVIVSILLWIAINGVVHAVLIPAERAVADGDSSAAARVSIGGMAVSVMFLIVVFLMVMGPK